jgi:hypothetical protein
MKRALLALALVAAFTGCSRSDRAEIREETRERGQDTAEAMNDRRVYQERLEARLDKLDREMEEERVKAKSRRMNAKAQAEYNERMQELDRLKAETREKYSQLKSATAEGWEDFKRGVDNATDELEQSWNRFVADMKT